MWINILGNLKKVYKNIIKLFRFRLIVDWCKCACYKKQRLKYNIFYNYYLSSIVSKLAKYLGTGLKNALRL